MEKQIRQKNISKPIENKEVSNSGLNGVNRRSFLGTVAAASALTIVPRHVLGGKGFVAPNDKTTVICMNMVLR